MRRTKHTCMLPIGAGAHAVADSAGCPLADGCSTAPYGPTASHTRSQQRHHTRSRRHAKPANSSTEVHDARRHGFAGAIAAVTPACVRSGGIEAAAKPAPPASRACSSTRRRQAQAAHADQRSPCFVAHADALQQRPAGGKRGGQCAPRHQGGSPRGPRPCAGYARTAAIPCIGAEDLR